MARDGKYMAKKAMETKGPVGNCGSNAVACEKEEENAVQLDKRHLAICPLDGRYSQIEKLLSPYFSEYALVKARVHIEVKWVLFLLQNIKSPILEEVYQIPGHFIDEIDDIAGWFNEEDFLEVKKIEEVTNHDVKACELYVADCLKQYGLDKLASYVHFGLTSEDVTNLAYARLIQGFIHEVYVPKLKELIGEISDMAWNYADTPMLAHTHGQAATPTTVGKELSVYVKRLVSECEAIERAEVFGKLNGATGNYSALSVAFPEYNWESLAWNFVENYICVQFNHVTTQIESHDYLACILDEVCHINNIIRDFDQDMWAYISRSYFKLKVVKSEVGSSTMPHKVNPINYENSEGNIKVGNPICRGLSDELTRSREQRDLSDSTVQRNLGMAFGYSIQAIEQTMKGLAKSDVNKEALAADLENNWAVLAEPIQTMLRKYGVADAYDQLKALTRGHAITEEDIHTFVSSLEMLNEEDKETLLKLTPSSYIGYASIIARKTVCRYLNQK